MQSSVGHFRLILTVSAAALLASLGVPPVGVAIASTGQLGTGLSPLRTGLSSAARSRVTLAERRAQIRTELAAAGRPRVPQRTPTQVTVRQLTSSELRALHHREARTVTHRARASDCITTAHSGVTADFVLTGPGGLVNWDYNEGEFCGEAPLPGYPDVHGYGGYAALFPGETITAAAAMYDSDAKDEQVSVTADVNCDDTLTQSSLGTVTAPPLKSAKTTQGAIVSFSFTVPAPGTAGCVDQPPVVSTPLSPSFGVTICGQVVGTSGFCVEETVGGIAFSVPFGQLLGCPGSPDSAWPPLLGGYCLDPVNTESGVFSGSFTDATLQGPGYPLDITRSYSSGTALAGPLGPGWSLPWQANLSIQPSGSVIFTAENGDQYVYAKRRGMFLTPPGARSVLTARKSSSGTVTGYMLTTPDHDVLSFNTAGQLQSMGDATGRGVSLGYSGSEVSSLTDAAGHQVSLGYTEGLLTQVNLPGGKTISYGYTGGLLTSLTDPAGNTTHYAYSSAGLLVSIQDPDGHYLVRNTYNSSGQVISQQNGTGATSTFSYTTTTGGLPETDVTDPEGGITTEIYNGGLLMQSIDPLGGVTSYSYNGFCEPILTTDPLGNVTTLGYDDNGNRISQTSPLDHEQQWIYNSKNDMTSSTNEDGKTTKYAYNAMHELTSEKLPSGGKATYAYDAAGSLISSTDPRGNVSGGNPSAYTTTYAYNSSGQLSSVTDPDGGVTSYTYDAEGYPTSVTDPDGNATTYTYDADERLVSTTAPDGGVTERSYDAAGNLVSLTDPDSNAWTYTYDADNRLVKVTDPLGNSARYSYDGDGNQTGFTDARGIVTTTAYDADNRLVKISYSDGTPTVSYTYDADGNVTGVTDATGTRTLTYDPDGNLTTVAGPGSGSFSYTYDPAGNVTSRTYPDGTKVTYAYNADGLVSALTVSSKKTTYSYDAADDLTSIVMPNGTTQARAYNGNAQLTGITDARGSSTLDSYALTLDPDGQPTQVAIIQNGTAQPTAFYGYNVDGRLTSACLSSSGRSACSPASNETTYTYDAAGNLTSSEADGVTTAYTHNADEELTKAVTGSETASYSYDADGDQTSAGNTSYSYNGAGELSQAAMAKTTLTFTYDSGGNLATTSRNGSLLQGTVWDLNNPLPVAVADIKPSGVTAADYVYQPGGELALMKAGGSLYYPVTDWLGSVSGLVNSSGTEVSATTYSPYGVPSTTDLVPGAPSSSIGYAGSYTIPGNIGLDDMRTRDYNPALGTYTSPDPLLAVTGQPYAYADDDPVGTTDPDGTITCPGWIPGCGVITDIQNSISAAVRAWWQQFWINNPCSSASAAFGATGSIAKLAQQFGYSQRQISSAIEQVKQAGMPRGGPVRNPDVVVDIDGEVYPLGPGGAPAEDSIGNIFDFLPELGF
jgi:RHS repeat-associated protein